MVDLNNSYRRFKLSDNFLEEYKSKEVPWGPCGYIVYKRCVDIETPILCDDLTWRPAGTLKEGDGILGFDEEPIKNNRNKNRYLRIGKVEYNNIETASCVGIELEDGQIIYCTPDHSWLVRMANSKLVWREAKDLESSTKNGPVYLPKVFGNPWSQENTYEAGYLAAAFDGEGSSDRTNSLCFTQVENSMLERVSTLLQQKNIEFAKKQRTKHPNRQECFDLRFFGIKNIVRFLGSIDSTRLKDKFLSQLNVSTNRRQGQALKCNESDYVKVVRVFDAGQRQVAVMSTSLKTHFTAGFPSHNTYARRLDENNPDAGTEEWWQTCQRVIEGMFDMQKTHCMQLGLPWNNAKAQRTAQDAYARLFVGKWTPPGRGLSYNHSSR